MRINCCLGVEKVQCNQLQVSGFSLEGWCSIRGSELTFYWHTGHSSLAGSHSVRPMQRLHHCHLGFSMMGIVCPYASTRVTNDRAWHTSSVQVILSRLFSNAFLLNVLWWALPQSNIIFTPCCHSRRSISPLFLSIPSCSWSSILASHHSMSQYIF